MCFKEAFIIFKSTGFPSSALVLYVLLIIIMKALGYITTRSNAFCIVLVE